MCVFLCNLLTTVCVSHCGSQFIPDSQEGDLDKASYLSASSLSKHLRHWKEFEDSQKILLTTPSVLVGYRVKVYRSEGTTQWYTAVIVSYNENSKVSCR